MKVVLRPIYGALLLACAASCSAAFLPVHYGAQTGWAGTNSGFNYLPSASVDLAGATHNFSEPAGQSGSGGESSSIIREGKIDGTSVWLSDRLSNTVRSSSGATSWYDFTPDCAQVKLEYKVNLSRLVWWDLAIVRVYDKTAGTILVTHEENGSGTDVITVPNGHILELYTGINQNNLNQWSYPAGDTNFVADGKITPVPEAPLSSITLLPNTVIGGRNTGAIVRLAGASGPLGTVVTLTAGAGATVPPTVAVPAGGTYVTFVVNTTAVNASTPISIWATFRSVTKTATLTVLPSPLSSIALLPNSVVGGYNTEGIVRLAGVAGPSGSVISLSSEPGATVPPTVTIPAAGSYAKFVVKTSPVSASTPVLIGASLGSVSKSAPLTVLPAPLASIALLPGSIVGGFNTQAIVRLASAAGPSGAVVSLTSGTGATVPATVTVPAGGTYAKFVVNSNAVDANTQVSIEASLGSVNKSAMLTLTPAPLSVLTLLPSTLKGGFNAKGIVRLAGKAGPSGVVVTISAGTGVTVPPSVKVPAGATYTTFVIQTIKVTVSTQVTVTVTRGGTSLNQVLTLTP